MTVVGSAEILIAPLTTGFDKALKEEVARSGGLASKEAELQGAQIGGGYRKGVSSETEKLAGDVEKHSTAASGALAKGLTFGLAGVGVAAIAAGVDVGASMQKADASIAAAAGTSVKAAGEIGTAFENTAFKSEYSAVEMAKAFGQVAGQLKETEGHALNAGHATQFMSAASDLATAKQIDLGTSTSALAGVMQAFQLKTTDAAHVSDVLYKTSVATGQGVDTLAGQLEKLHGKLGEASPAIGELSGLMVDMTDRGITGRAALGAVNTAMTSLIKNGGGVQAAFQAQIDAYKELNPGLQKLVTGYDKGSISTTDFHKATAALAPDQAALVASFEKAGKAVDTAKAKFKEMGVTVFDEQGKFVGMRDIIAQLHGRFADMTQQQQLAAASTLFGAGAARQMLSVIQAGPAAYDKATASVNRHGAAQTAAAKQTSTLHGQEEVLKAGFVDLAAKLGGVLLPALISVTSAVLKGTTFVISHKAALIALAAVVTGILGPAIAVFTINKMASFVGSFKDASSHVKTFASDVESVVTRVGTAFSKQNTAATNMADTVKTQTAAAGTAAAEEATEVEASATSIEGSNTAAGTSFAAEATAADTAAADIGTAEAAATTAVSAADSTIEAENAAAGASFAAIAAAAAPFLGAVGVAGGLAAAGTLGAHALDHGGKVGTPNSPLSPTTVGGVPTGPGLLGRVGNLLGIHFGAEGAIVNQKTLAVIGEAGPEALVPLNRAPGAQVLPNNFRSNNASAHAAGAFQLPATATGQALIDDIVNYGKSIGASPKEIQAAVETALVEQPRLDNGAYGDGTSVGWRQETASSYGAAVAPRLDLRNTIPAFYNEERSGNQSGTAGQLAQSVQRSAYPGRYDQQAAAASARIAAAGGLGGPISTSGAGASSSLNTKLTAQQKAELAKQTADLKAASKEATKLLGAIHSGSLKQLHGVLTGQNDRALTKLVSSLEHDHSAALAEIGKKLVAVHEKALAAEAKAEIAATQAAAKAEQQKQLNAEISGLTLSAKITQDKAQAAATSIADQTKISLDQQSEAGLTGAALVAGQAQTKLDQVTSFFDVGIAQAQQKVDEASNSSPLVQAQAADNLAQVQAAATVTEAQAQATVDQANYVAQQAANAASATPATTTTTTGDSTPAAAAAATSSPTFIFQIDGNVNAPALMKEIAWQLTIGGLPVAAPAAA